MNRKDRRAAKKSGTAATDPKRDDQVGAVLASAVRQHQAGQLADAEQLYRAVLAVAPKHAQSFYLLGLVAVQRARPQEGIAWISKALALNDRVPEWHYNLAFAYQSIERFDQAIAHYRRASVLDPSDHKARTNLGNALTLQGKLSEAAECYRRVLTLEGDTAQTCCNLANVLGRQGDWVGAIAQYDRAMALAPDDASVRTNSGIALAAVGRWDEAIARHQRALALDPNLVEARMNLGAALQAQQRINETLAQYEAVIALRPDYPEAHNSLGLALLAKNDARAAARRIEHAISLKPASIPFHDDLARALLAAGDAVSAVAVLAHALNSEETPNTKRLVVWCLTGLNEFPLTHELRDLVLRALTEPWDRIDDFAHVGAGLVTLNPALAVAVGSGNCSTRPPPRLDPAEVAALHAETPEGALRGRGQLNGARGSLYPRRVAPAHGIAARQGHRANRRRDRRIGEFRSVAAPQQHSVEVPLPAR